MNFGGKVAVWGLAALCAAPASAAFHAPATPAEKALDRTLHAIDADANLLDNLVHRPGSRQTVDYRSMLTPALIAAIQEVERQLVKKNCGGHYRNGEECGLDYSPITCAQDTSPVYHYHTVLDLGPRQVIEYAWPDEDKRVATYTLQNTPKGWRIDGVSCASGAGFN